MRGRGGLSACRRSRGHGVRGPDQLAPNRGWREGLGREADLTAGQGEQERDMGRCDVQAQEAVHGVILPVR